MCFLAQDFIDLACSNLAKSGGLNEAENRSIVHLLYYGLYHYSYALANSVRYSDLQDEQGSSHKKLQDFFNDLIGSKAEIISQENARKFKSLSYKMKLMHSNRVLADYDLRYKCNSAFIQIFKKNFDSCLSLILELNAQYGAVEQPALAQG